MKSDHFYTWPVVNCCAIVEDTGNCVLFFTTDIIFRERAQKPHHVVLCIFFINVLWILFLKWGWRDSVSFLIIVMLIYIYVCNLWTSPNDPLLKIFYSWWILSEIMWFLVFLYSCIELICVSVRFFFCPRAWTWLLDRSVDVLIVCDDYSKCFWSCMPFLVLLEYHERGFRTACQKV